MALKPPTAKDKALASHSRQKHLPTCLGSRKVPKNGVLLMLICVLGNQARSMGNFWRVLIRHMRAAGHDVVCAAPSGDAACEQALTTLGCSWRHYPLDRKGLNPLHDIQTFLALSRLFREERPDLLFASTIKPVIYGCLAARFCGVPHIYATITGLGYAFERNSLLKKAVHALGARLYRWALAGAEGVFFQNADDVSVFRQSGILGHTARVLHANGTGVDTQHFSPAPLPDYTPDGRLTGSPVFLMVARLLEAKGLLEFVEAAQQVKKRHPEARFQLLGPEEQGLGSISIERVRQWEAQGWLEYLGATNDVRPFMAAAHVLVLPSWREGTPTCIMEGMSMGRAAVVTDVPGCREVVRDGLNGWLVPLRDPTALASALLRFLEEPQSIARMGAAGRERALAEFDADRVAQGILHDMHIPV